MPYIGVSPQFGVRRKHTYTATAGQTSFSGAGSEGATLSYTDSNFVDVYQNGVKLGDADYTSTSGTAIVLAQGASVDDLVEIIVFDAFSISDTVSKADGGSFEGAITANAGVKVDNITIDGTEIDLSSGDLTLDVAGDIILDADGGDVKINDGGTARFHILTSPTDTELFNQTQDADIVFKGDDGGATVEAMRIDMSQGGLIRIGGSSASNLPSAQLDVKGHFRASEDAQTVHPGSASSTQNAITQKSSISSIFDIPFRVQFPNGTSNLAVRLYLAQTSLWAAGQCILSSTYSNANASGFRLYRWSHSYNSSTQYQNVLSNTENQGSTSSHFEFNSHGWDSSESAHYFEFRHIASTGNIMYVNFQLFGSSSSYQPADWYYKHTTY